MNLLLAMCLGALIGAERQWRQRMAGLRTNALVATELPYLFSVLMLHHQIALGVLPHRLFRELVSLVRVSLCVKA